MPVSIALTFPGGRFHATPWGHHVNECFRSGRPRRGDSSCLALAAVWKRKLPQLPREAVEGVLSGVGEDQTGVPSPPRHARPHPPLHAPGLDRREQANQGVRRFRFARPRFRRRLPLDRSELARWWANARPVAVATRVLRTGGIRVRRARILPEFDASRLNCKAGSIASGQEAVRVLTADPGDMEAMGFQGQEGRSSRSALGPARRDGRLAPGCWSDPPGSKWVTYARLADCFAPLLPPPRVSPRDAKTDYIVARDAIDVARGRAPLPLVPTPFPWPNKLAVRSCPDVVRRRSIAIAA